jgi:polyisoprenoid-binding protein YceI
MSYRTPTVLATAAVIAGGAAAQGTATVAAPDAATQWRIDAAHSAVGFAVKHMGISTVRGRFAAYDGVIETGEGLALRRIDVTIEPASIATGVERRDNHLRSPDFFDVAKHPTITFKSTAVKPNGKDSYLVTGDFTMRGVTKPITLPVTVLGEAKDPMGTEKMGLETGTTLNRKEYGLNWNRTLETGGVLVGDEVKVQISVEANKAKPAAQ